MGECYADRDHGPDYEGHGYRCRACEARDVKAREFSEDSNASTAGMHFVAVRVDDD